ncbi:alanine racemase [Nocardioides sp. BP30]|uniref:alanine racemase n=1 Tax=Nocardioides sp. BP30 TaxID=3036374 RepID=UPI002468E220|nr:alanine racemase [Nocardioides sp. BP30]WGL53270.1 alanine racemase [Nocardioides sp. BP30]
MSRAEIVVDLAAIRRNVRALRERTGVAMMTVVKADGYGHGMLASARAAREAGSEWLGVATIDEALALRAGGDSGRLLCWLTVPADDLAPVLAADVDVTAYTVEGLERVAAAAVRAGRGATGRPARVQLKVDTGLSRGGATAAQWPEVVARARAGERDGTWRITGIWSHFSTSEIPEDPANAEQEAAFEEALAVAAAAGLQPEVRHLANSAAALLRPSSRYDLVRCGLASYGLDPAPGRHDLALVPAMTVRADLALVKQIDAGASVSYGHTWTATAPTTLGLVPIGYAEGISRHAAAGGGDGGAEVLVGKRRRPIRGAICMDQFVVDLDGDTPPEGDEVLLWGPGTRGEPTAEDWARVCDTISYEIVTRVGGRLTRRYVDGVADQHAHDDRHDDRHDAPGERKR